ncbi:hypothetical protein DSECCO2_496290 [anaerobic digester metagenome]
MSEACPYKLVLDNRLLILFERFKDGGFKEELDNQKIIKLLSRIKLPYITNAKQVEECRAELPIEFYESIQPGLIAAATPEQTLEDLAQLTSHRVILTERPGQFPYIDINSQTFDSNFSMTCHAFSARTELLAHIKHLIENAIRVHIIDQHLHEAIGRGNCSIENLISDPSIEIVCHDSPNERGTQNNFICLKKYFKSKKLNNKVTLKNVNFCNIHDRYLEIEHSTHKYKILLSSGFEYLFCTKKEITCVFKEM